jgi:hypothetical protein
MAAGTEMRPVKGKAGPQFSFRPGGTDSLQEIAEQTGGRALFDTNDLSGAIRIAQEDSAVNYTLGYYPPPESLDGRFHEFHVQVNRAGLNVRYRKGYFAERDHESGSSGETALEAALWSPLESSSVALRARVDRVAGAQPEALRVAYAVDVRNLQLAERNGVWRGAINVVFVQQDANGAALDRVQEAFDLNFAKDTYEGYLKKALMFGRQLEQKPGLATLRVVLFSRNNGAVGSLLIPYSQVQ